MRVFQTGGRICGNHGDMVLGKLFTKVVTACKMYKGKLLFPSLQWNNVHSGVDFLLPDAWLLNSLTRLPRTEVGLVVTLVDTKIGLCSLLLHRLMLAGIGKHSWFMRIHLKKKIVK